MIRSKNIKRILAFAIKRREQIKLVKLNFDREVTSNRSLSEDTFTDFFKINTDFRINSKSKKAGKTILDPNYTLPSLDINLDQFYHILTNKHQKNYDPYKSSKVTRLEIGNWINNNQIYDMEDAPITSSYQTDMNIVSHRSTVMKEIENHEAPYLEQSLKKQSLPKRKKMIKYAFNFRITELIIYLQFFFKICLIKIVNECLSGCGIESL